MNIVLLGAPGAGKGTQAALLVEKFGMCHISTGDMLRAAMREGSDLGRKAESFISAGQLVPDEVVNGIVAARLASEHEGYLLDGYPRTIAQADSLESAGESIDAVVLIDVPDDLLVARIVGRLSCGKCGAVYHRTTMPPKVDGVCDNCGSALVQRSDDTEEVVRRRLDAYHAQTQPLVDYYKERGLLYSIDGSLPVGEVFAAIRKVLGF